MKNDHYLIGAYNTWKLKMEPEHEPLENAFGKHHFQVSGWVLNFRGVKRHKEPLYEWGAMSTMGIYYLIP